MSSAESPALTCFYFLKYVINWMHQTIKEKREENAETACYKTVLLLDNLSMQFHLKTWVPLSYQQNLHFSHPSSWSQIRISCLGLHTQSPKSQPFPIPLEAFHSGWTSGSCSRKSCFLNLDKKTTTPRYFTWKFTVVIISREGKMSIAFRAGSQMLEKIQTCKEKKGEI